MSVADNTSYRDSQTGKKLQFTSWIPVVGFGQKAEFMKKHLKKGMMIGLTGEWRNHVFEKNGERRYTMELKMGMIQFCDSVGKQQAGQSDDMAGDQAFMSVASLPFGENFEMPSFIPEEGDEE